MSQRKTMKNRKIEKAVRKMQATHSAFTEFVKLNEMLISAMDQDNLARVKSLSEKIDRCQDQIGKLVGPSSKAMEEALHDRWPTEFRAPSKPKPQHNERVSIDKEIKDDNKPPTLEEYVAAGYKPSTYPPSDYPEVPSPGLTAYKAKVAKDEHEAKKGQELASGDGKNGSDTDQESDPAFE